MADMLLPIKQIGGRSLRSTRKIAEAERMAMLGLILTAQQESGALIRDLTFEVQALRRSVEDQVAVAKLR